MDSRMKLTRSLPPLVEGRIHGSLRLVINEVLWIGKSPGNVAVVALWWGERDNARFRPRDSTVETDGTIEDITEVYAVRTNETLFEDYIKNCDGIELAIVAEDTQVVIGRGYVGELFRIFSCKYYSRFIPVLSNTGHKIGKLCVSLQLTYLTKLFSNALSKICKYNEKKDRDILPSTDDLRRNGKMPAKRYDDTGDDSEVKKSANSEKINIRDTYRSVFKSERFQESRNETYDVVTNKLVTRIVARAQRLRKAILKETRKEDSSSPSDNSSNDESFSNALSDDGAKLYKYILGMEMTPLEERMILDTSRSLSPNFDSTDPTSKIITSNKNDDTSIGWKNDFSVKLNTAEKDALDARSIYPPEFKGMYPLDCVNSIRIFIESLTLTPAGYRRAKSTCLRHNVPLSLTYFIQYDTTFASRINSKSNKETKKFVRTCAMKQVGRVVKFNSEGIHSISRCCVTKNFHLKFKVFVKHRNQKFPSELGLGVASISNVTDLANLSSVRCISVINKGIKIGDLKVITELGYDFIHFGKEFVDAVIFRKDDLPISMNESSMISNDDEYNSATGTRSAESNCKVSSAKRVESLTGNSDKDVIVTKDTMERRKRNLDNKKIDTSHPESGAEDKVLLHGLIYVAEGKDLSESNTYLICRAFWREDKATSQICNDTNDPFYHFFQLVPLIHGTELLERIKDNYIIIEVYGRPNDGTDDLLGIAKLPVHQLYVAYRDPHVLPRLLLSKYPVISVDDWVDINDPVNGKFCGKLLALVALGTVEQIALLEASRGLRNANDASRIAYSRRCCISENINDAMGDRENLRYNVPEMPNLNFERSTCDNNFARHVYNMPDRDSTSVDCKTRESQTDNSSLKNERLENSIRKAVSSEHLTLRTLVDRLTNVLRVDKISTNQTARTETNRMDEGEVHRELCSNIPNSLTNDNDCDRKNDFRLPTNTYRSVGVGAEYDEDLDRRRNNAYHFSNLPLTERNTQKVESNLNRDGSFFRSVVEIECALHLPMIEGPNESIEPSTYVTFQDLTRKLDSADRIDSYIATNIFLHSCNPKWNWRCDVELSTDLLLNNQKRLILKVWHSIDPDVSKDINLRRDIVIGFSAIDLSVLMAGFPTVSGWFHIMDFTGKCNGQIKINITPLDNLLSLGKFAPINTTNLSMCSNLSQTSSHSHNAPRTTELDSAHRIPYASENNERYIQNDCKLNMDIGHNLEDVSMSSLSLSLKQKLTELDEITKRLQSRLQDVTNTAFEDEFDNDFDTIEPNGDDENTNDGKVETARYPRSTISEYFNNEMSRMPKQCEGIRNDRNIINDERRRTSSVTISDSNNLHIEPTSSDKDGAVSFETTDIGFLSSSNIHFDRHPDCYRDRCQNRYNSMHNYLSDSDTEYPMRGTKTHINHLLDKLSLDLPPRSASETIVPIRRNVLELFASLRECKDNSRDGNKNGRNINTYAMLTQTDNERQARATNFIASETTVGESVFVESPRNRMSTVIREELLAEENDDGTTCDELTTYLITSNIRHMDLDSIFDPLLCQRLVPDLQVAAAASPEGEIVEQLDNRYAKSFDVTTRNGNIDRSRKNIPFQDEARPKDWATALEFDKKKELFGLTSSDISENVDNSIDVTIVCKSSDDDLTSSNSPESIAVTSLGESSIRAEIEIKDRSILSESIPGVLRQAPEGGNPMEEVKTSVTVKWQNDS